MKSHFFILLILVVGSLPFTNGGCAGDASDFLPDPDADFYGVVVDDLNDDGFPDIAAAMDYWDEGTTYYATVILNDPDSPGDFFPADAYRIPSGCCLDSIASGDINDDGLADLVTENGANIFILFQDMGNIGTFLPAVYYPCQQDEFGFGAWSVAAGDFNDDSLNDLVVSENGIVIRWQDPATPGTYSARWTVYNPH